MAVLKTSQRHSVADVLGFSARNVIEKVTLDSIRAVQAKDAHGNVIGERRLLLASNRRMLTIAAAEPDLCNPTRSRWERPLDTIRSFERAIDGDYHRRTASRGPSEYDSGNNQQYASRRSSYYGSPQSRPNHGYYGGRSESYNDGYNGPPRARFNRGMSENGMGRYSNSYGSTSQMGYYGTQEGSDSTGPWANSTDPSSQNSSFERLNGMNKHGQSPEHYNMHDPYAGQPISEERDDYGLPPQPPSKGYNNYPQQQNYAPEPARQPIKLGGGGGSGMYEHQGGQLPSAARSAPSPPEKRQSWLGRRFSKNR